MTRRYIHDYKREYGGTLKELLYLYFRQGKDYDEIQDMLKCPRASIRRSRQEFLHETPSSGKRGFYAT